MHERTPKERVSDAFALLDATAQADLVRRGDVQPVELVEAAIARIERLNPTLNACRGCRRTIVVAARPPSHRPLINGVYAR
jgi:Asp-tRNA(Asn)/Glu-tRNA(Gln) amidotransferase A subunit family amidase